MFFPSFFYLLAALVTFQDKIGVTLGKPQFLQSLFLKAMVPIAHSTFYAQKKNTWKAERTPKLVIFLEVSKKG